MTVFSRSETSRDWYVPEQSSASSLQPQEGDVSRETLFRAVQALGPGAMAALILLLGGGPSATRVAEQLRIPIVEWTTFDERRRRLTWREVRRLAIEILEQAEARRLAIAQAEARLYAEPDDTAE